MNAPNHNTSPPRHRQRATLIDWRPLHRNTLCGFCAVRFESGIEVYEIAIHVAGSRAWASPPGKPWIDANGQVVRDDDGKIKYQRIIGFLSHGVRSAWSRTVLNALRAVHPEVFPEVTDDGDNDTLALGEGMR
jgi:hypothetical protein